MSEVQRFQAILTPNDEGVGTAITIPFDVPKVFGKRGRVAVCGTINGVAYRSSVFRMGDAPFFMVVNRRMREEGGLKAGQVVSVVMERDDEPRTIEAPDDLTAALKASPEAFEAWARLSFTHQREHVEAITGAKRPETRARRIAKAIEHVSRRTKR